MPLVPAGTYRDCNERRIKLMHALDRLLAETGRLVARNRELPEELSRCKVEGHQGWRSSVPRRH